MSLESGSYIKDLNPNNPTSSDQVSEGDNHLGLIKKCVQNSFPGFVGVEGSPAFVTLSEAEINNAALKSAAQTIGGAWTFSQNITAPSFGGVASDNLVDKLAVETIAAVWNFTARPTFNSVGLATLNEIPTTDTFALKRTTYLGLSAGRALTQTDEDKVLSFTSGSVTIPNGMAVGTTFCIQTAANSAAITLVQQAGLLMYWLAGDNSTQSGTRTLAKNSTVTIYYSTTGIARIFGNGLT